MILLAINFFHQELDRAGKAFKVGFQPFQRLRLVVQLVDFARDHFHRLFDAVGVAMPAEGLFLGFLSLLFKSCDRFF